MSTGAQSAKGSASSAAATAGEVPARAANGPSPASASSGSASSEPAIATAPPVPPRAGSLWPGRGLLHLLVAWSVTAVVAMAWPASRMVFLVSGAVLAAALGISAVRLRRTPPPAVERLLASSLPLGEWTEVTLRLEAPEGRDLRLEIFDHYPTQAELEGLPQSLRLEGGGTWDVRYRLRPRERGSFAFGRVELWIRSPGDLLRRRWLAGREEQVRVLPNFRPVLERGLAGVERKIAQLGAHLQRRRGDGSEFQSLRDYRYGDSMRVIDWKATSRRYRLISREYQDERNQQLVLLLDCGRRMHAREGDLTHFDHVLDGCLMLAYVAGRQGDAVGFRTFAGEPRHLPPVRGPQALGRLLEGLYDLRTTNQSPDYPSAAAELMETQRRRALVVLLTNLRDEDSDEVITAVHTLSRRHLVLVASSRELALRHLGEQPVRSFDAALEVAATRLYLQHRRRAHDAARSAGAFVIDVEPQDLPAVLVHRYLEIKRAGQL